MISVIVPFYNAEKTIKRCIESILAQSYKNIEVLLVDDGSTDKSGMLADGYITDLRVQVFHKNNGGLSSARNYGMEKARGDYLSFVDADDWIEPNTYEAVMNSIHNADICIFGRSADSPGKSRTWKPVDIIEVIDNEEAIRRLIVDSSIKQAVWDKVYKRELFDGIHFPEGHNYEDIIVTHRILQNAQQIVLLPDILYHYVQTNGSISHTPSVQNGLDLWMACHKLYEEYKGKGKDYYQACLKNCMNSIYRVWGSLWKAEKTEKDSEQVQQIISFAKLHCKETEGQGQHIRLVVYFAASGTRGGVFLAYGLKQMGRLLHPRRLYR